MALAILDKTEDELFDIFVSDLIAQALKIGKSKRTTDEAPNDDTLSEEVVSGRIRKWFHHPEGHPYKMLKAFLTVSHHMNKSIEEPVDRFKMSGYFKAFADCDESKFESIFRQMCSGSKRAYGDVFLYNRKTREVSLNKKYIDLVSALDNIEY